MSDHVLLCDDEPYILRAAEFKLRRAGLDIVTACDGEDGWQSIRRKMPSVVVTDLQMPRLDGLGLVARIRENEFTRELPVILLTAKGFELPHDQIREQWQLSAIMVKPFSPRELVSTVEQLIAVTKDTVTWPVETV